jgi:autotransporter-associated beta strand protein
MGNLTGSGTISLGGAQLTVGGDGNTKTFSGSISGTGSLVKTGTGTLTLSGTNSYGGSTKVNAGALVVTGSSSTSEFIVNSGGTLSGSGAVKPVTVSSGGTLKGTGTWGDVTNSGTLAPGNSIGTINITGNYTQATGSTLEIEISPTQSDKVIVSGNVTIQSGASVHLIPDIGSYNSNSYTIISSTGGTVSGTFGSIYSDSPLVSGVLNYPAGQVVLTVNGKSISSITVTSGGNPAIVAEALDAIISRGSTAVNGIFSSLLGLSTPAQITQALNQMSPALYKGMTVVQENNIAKVEGALGMRWQARVDSQGCRPQAECAEGEGCPTSCIESKPLEVWFSGLGDFLNQKPIFAEKSNQFGYRGNTGGFVTGLDYKIVGPLYAGVLGAYTHSHVRWTHNQGSGDINTGYAGIYASAQSQSFYGNLSVIGGWGSYEGNRNVIYPGVNATAHTRHPGLQIITHIDGGANFTVNQGVVIRPIEAFEYISQKEHGFVETGAGEYNLSAKSCVAQMIRNTLGVNASKCFTMTGSRWVVDLGMSWIYEARFKGKGYTAQFAGTGVNFTTYGYFPDRSLYSPTVSVSGWLLKDRLVVESYYQGEFGRKYNDQTIGLQAAYRF